METRVKPGAAYLWQIAIALALAFAAMRVTGVLGPRGLRWMLPLGFTLMALAPFLLLDAAGRRDMGLRAPMDARAYLAAVFAGCAAGLACFALGYTLFGTSGDNWFVTIANNYRQTMDTTGWPVTRLHLYFTIPALIFSPIGEEIFFRGYLQYALERRFSVRASTIAECAAFGLVHLCHHGLALTASGIALRSVSGPIWVTLMFSTALLFAFLRKSSGSLFPAIVAHVCFNLVMNLTIFGFLWDRSS
jgi:membrane protease YdiL (CAAX protease family)